MDKQVTAKKLNKQGSSGQTDCLLRSIDLPDFRFMRISGAATSEKGINLYIA